MTWPRRPEHGRVAQGGARLLVALAMLVAASAPAAAQSPDAAPPAPGPAPDPAPQATPAPEPAPAAPAPAQTTPPPAPAPLAESSPAPVATPAAQPRPTSTKRREPSRRGRRPVKRRKPTSERPRRRTFGVTALPATVTAPRLVAEPGTPLASTEARLAALALLIAAAGCLGLVDHLRRATIA
jgi:outer membrane biosynthesis protein TonB